MKEYQPETPSEITVIVPQELSQKYLPEFSGVLPLISIDVAQAVFSSPANFLRNYKLFKNKYSRFDAGSPPRMSKSSFSRFLFLLKMLEEIVGKNLLEKNS